ncbi:hypothetical protein J4P02_24575 [Pseudomonas sp. NFXW11]|uniref:hypothetical protein n=1 Tax=Pseudomonas sp. NFXW11 TaxID=2819531 RepID=UPI003CF0FA55
MPSRSKPASALLSISMTALLLGSMALPLPALAAIDYQGSSSSSSDQLGVIHRDAHGTYTLHSSGYSSADLEKLQDQLKSTHTEMEKLQSTISDQARTIEELKRSVNDLSSRVK